MALVTDPGQLAWPLGGAVEAEACRRRFRQPQRDMNCKTGQGLAPWYLTLVSRSSAFPLNRPPRFASPQRPPSAAGGPRGVRLLVSVVLQRRSWQPTVGGRRGTSIGR